MESSKENLVDSTTQASGEVVKTDTVAYESYRKSVEAEKRAKDVVRETKSYADQLKAELDAYKTKELEAQGKHQEVAEALRKQVHEAQIALKREQEANAWKTVTSAIKTEAMKQGFKNTDRLIKLFDKEDLESLRVQNGEIDSESLAALIERAKRDDFLPTMIRPSVTVNDIVPSNKIDQPVKKKASDMSHDEIKNSFKNSLGVLLK